MDYSIKELVERFYAEMLRLAYSNHALRGTSAVVSQIVKMHALHKKECLDEDILNEYIRASTARLSRDQIGRAYSQLQIYTTKRLLEFSKSGKLEIHRFQLPYTALNPYYDLILDKFLEDTTQSPKTKKKIAWGARKYASWLIAHRIDNLGDVTAKDVRQFIVDNVKCLKDSSISTLRCNVRQFCKWAFEKGHSANSFEGLFHFSAAMERKIFPAPLPEEVALVLNFIDRDTIEGKRNYAIIMIGIVTGLRAGDVANIRFSDFDWRVGDIKIMQGKTGKSLALPLTQDAGDAISDYILNARPQNESDKIFLRLRAPIQPFSGGTAIGGIYSKYRVKLGLSPDGFHSLRRALGKNLVTSGTPVTTAAQVLGHSDISNIKQYIALDVVHLKDCALDFTGIAPKRGTL